MRTVPFAEVSGCDGYSPTGTESLQGKFGSCKEKMPISANISTSVWRTIFLPLVQKSMLRIWIIAPCSVGPKRPKRTNMADSSEKTFWEVLGQQGTVHVSHHFGHQAAAGNRERASPREQVVFPRQSIRSSVSKVHPQNTRNKKLYAQ